MDFKLKNPCTGMFQIKDQNGNWVLLNDGSRLEIGPFSDMPVLSLGGGVLIGLEPIKLFLCKKFGIKDSAVLVAKTTGGIRG